MSLNLIKSNSSSPFRLQRSMVDQGGEGGAYESGGFDPNMVYNNDAANAAVESLGKVIGAGLSSRTEGDENEANKRQVKRLQSRGERLVKKSANSEGDKMIRIEKRIGNIGLKIQNTNANIKEYEKSINPYLKAGLNIDLTKYDTNKKLTSTDNKTKTEYLNYLNLKPNQESNKNVFGPQEDPKKKK